MNKNIKSKLRTIVLSAVASLYHANTQAEVVEVKNTDNSEDFNPLTSIKEEWNRIYKNVAKIDKNGEVKYIAGHRSHMSHRSGGSGSGGGHYSHSSHYSSYGGGGGGSTHYSSSSSNSSLYSSSSTAHTKTVGEYVLGDRTLKNGSYGSDVTSLTGYLANCYYINRASIQEKQGYSLYDPTIISAVKHFQKDAGLPQTGIADAKTISSLKEWDGDKTSVILGIRTLSYNADNEMKGTDVTELVNLLSKAGFPPNPQKIAMSNDGRTIFTKDIQTAIKLFQAYNKIAVNGVATDETIKALRLKAK